MKHRFCLALLVVGAAACVGLVKEPFSSLVGGVKVAPVSWKAGQPLEVPFITWGGDVATFHANGGLATKANTIYGKLGLNLKLVPGDDFVTQVKRYVAGQSPFLRGTMRMLGLASGVIGQSPQTRAVVFLQMTWSAGDHMVARDHLKTFNALKGKKVALQKGGPHVGMLDDVLRTAKLDWKDITVVWTDDLTGDKGPAAAFRKDKSIDACMVISPDMGGLTGGLTSVGTGAEGTVKGAHVLISTSTLSRSIADVYACRKDFYDAHRDLVEKFVAGYLKASEEVSILKKEYDDKGAAPKYREILQLTQDIYGKEVIPTLEIDAHGLISDCRFVRYAGNVFFFTKKGYLDGFERKQKLALDLAVRQGYAESPPDFLAPQFDYSKIARIGGLQQTELPADSEIAKGSFTTDPKEAGFYFFTIAFEPNNPEFDAAKYGTDFERVIELASTFGNAAIAVRGHTDPTKTLRDLVSAGLEKGILKRTGSPGNYRYFLNGKPLDLTDTKKMVELIEAGTFDGAAANPKETLQAGTSLSLARADAVRKAVIRYAATKEYLLNEAQLSAMGVGIIEPVIPRPNNYDEAAQNMRVEFRLQRVSSEPTKAADFDF